MELSLSSWLFLTRCYGFAAMKCHLKCMDRAQRVKPASINKGKFQFIYTFSCYSHFNSPGCIEDRASVASKSHSYKTAKLIDSSLESNAPQ